MTGADFERAVRQMFHEAGFATLRVAGSGTEKAESCDVIALNENAILFIECKTYSDPARYIVLSDEDQQMSLLKGDVLSEHQDDDKVRDVRSIVALRGKGKAFMYYSDLPAGGLKPANVDDMLIDLLKEYKSGGGE